MTSLPADALLYEDFHLLALNKPAPLLTQAPPGIPSLELLAKAYLKEKYQKPAGVYLGVPHRLDRPVGGVVLFARNSKAARRVHDQFHERTVKKVYWALVSGCMSSSFGTWEDFIRKVPDQPRVERAAPEDEGSKRASVEYRVLSVLRETTLLELMPLTGRMHQLRAQCAWHGHPVLGDTQYGSTIPFGPSSEVPRERVIALYARSLEFDHPFTKQRLTVEAPLPAYWASELEESTMDHRENRR